MVWRMPDFPSGSVLFDPTEPWNITRWNYTAHGIYLFGWVVGAHARRPANASLLTLR